jgi:hypothetical protein
MRILYCHCAYARVVPPEVKEEVLRALSEGETDFDAVPDLCEMSARRDPALKEIAEGGDTVVVACYPRAVKWLFHAAGTPLSDNVRVLNMRVEPAAEIVRNIQGVPQHQNALMGPERQLKEVDPV